MVPLVISRSLTQSSSSSPVTLQVALRQLPDRAGGGFWRDRAGHPTSAEVQRTQHRSIPCSSASFRDEQFAGCVHRELWGTCERPTGPWMRHLGPWLGGIRLMFALGDLGGPFQP